MADDFDPSFEQDERVFHYTTSAGLFGILQSNCIWATHYRFLNDSKEFYAAKESLVRIFSKSIFQALIAEKINRRKNFKSDFDPQAKSKEAAEHVVNHFYGQLIVENIGSIESFVFSTFSCRQSEVDFENGGLLHWASYGRSGGYSIQINPHKLFQLLKEEDENHCSVYVSSAAVYDADNGVTRDLKIASDTVQQYGRSYAKFLISDGKEKPEPPELIIPHLLTLMALVKDPYFKAEREARLVVFRPEKVSNGKPPPHPISIRLSGAVPVPYIQLFDGRLLGPNCPIERIIVGPHPDNIRRKFALETFLKSKGLSSIIDVTESKVPFVGTPF